MAFDFPFLKEAVTQLFQKSSCEEYPFKPKEAFDGYRGRIVFHGDKCIHCGMCERVCAGGAIETKLVESTEEGDKYERSFFLGSCTFCSYCADFCTTHAIELTKDFAMVATDPEDLIVRGTYMKKKRPVKPKPAPAAAPAEVAAPAEEKKAAPAAAAPAEAAAAAPAAEAAKPAVQPRDDGKPALDESKCIYCTLCARKCPAEALTVDRAAKTWTLDEDKCIGCGVCADNCPKQAIVI